MVDDLPASGAGILSEDLEAQFDEVLVLKSIYSDNFVVLNEEERTFEISVKLDNESCKVPAILRFTMVAGYPSSRGPTFSVSAPSIPRQFSDHLVYCLNEVCDLAMGSPMIHFMVQRLETFLDEFYDAEQIAKCLEDVALDSEKVDFPSLRGIRSSRTFSPQEGTSDFRSHLNIFHGDPITDRKSVFQAHCCHVASMSDVSSFIEKMLEDGKIAAATHNITAWYLRARLNESSPTTSLIADFDDDGETHAGSRLLHLLQMAANEGVVVMVSRWYGGIKLGPDRFKHINNAACTLLSEHNFMKSSSVIVTKKAKHKGKK